MSYTDLIYYKMLTWMSLITLLSICPPWLVSGLRPEQEMAFKDYNVSFTRDADKNYIFVGGMGPPPGQGPTIPGDAPHPKPDNITVISTPAKLERPGCVPEGIVGIAVNGVPIHMPYNKEGEPFNDTLLGNCSGVMTQDKMYFYPRIPNCLLDDLKSKNPSETKFFIGVALDGFPIFVSTTAMADLDQCNFLDDKATRGYFLTTAFPHTIACFHGKVLMDQPKGAKCVYANVTSSTGWDDPGLTAGEVQTGGDTVSSGCHMTATIAMCFLMLTAATLST